MTLIKYKIKGKHRFLSPYQTSSDDVNKHDSWAFKIPGFDFIGMFHFQIKIFSHIHMSRAMRKCVLFHMRTTKAQISLISAFVVRCLDSVMSLVSVTKISSLMLASVAEQAGLSLTWSETSEDTFSHDEAHNLFICYMTSRLRSKKISNNQELIQSDPISCPQNQNGNN